MHIMDCIILIDMGQQVNLYDYDIGERFTRYQSVATIIEELTHLGYRPVWQAAGVTLLTRQPEEPTLAEIDQLLLEHLP